MRHGAGKIHAARAAISLIECKQDTWAYETDFLMTRQPHGVSPDGDLGDNASIKMQVEHAWGIFQSKVIFLTLSQRTSDWFLARYFRFISTTLHVAVNVKAAVYINTSDLRTLYARIIGILRLKPQKTITVIHAVDLEDEDLPTQRTHQVRTEGQGERGSILSDEKGAEEYWLRGNPTVATLRLRCTNNGISVDTNPSPTQKMMAKFLGDKFCDEWHHIMSDLLQRDVPEDDSAANKLAMIAFLQRMMPHWFMRPFAACVGGAIEQGVQN